MCVRLPALQQAECFPWLPLRDQDARQNERRSLLCIRGGCREVQGMTPTQRSVHVAVASRERPPCLVLLQLLQRNRQLLLLCLHDQLLQQLLCLRGLATRSLDTGEDERTVREGLTIFVELHFCQDLPHVSFRRLQIIPFQIDGTQANMRFVPVGEQGTRALDNLVVELGSLVQFSLLHQYASKGVEDRKDGDDVPALLAQAMSLQQGLICLVRIPQPPIG